MLVTHTIITTTTGRDWVPILAQVFGASASAIVAVVAVWLTTRQAQKAMELSDRQNAATRQINERQTKIAEAKVIAELFDRRLAAWMTFEKAWQAYLRAIMNGYEDENGVYLVSPAAFTDFNEAASLMYFLFPDDITAGISTMRNYFDTYQQARQTAILVQDEAEEAANKQAALTGAHLYDSFSALREDVRAHLDASI